MKRALAILIAAMLLAGLGACGGKGKEDETAPIPGEGSGTLTLVADYSCGSEIPNRQEYPYSYAGPENDGPGVTDMAQGLSELTGLDFTLLEVTTAGSTGMLIVWSPESSLFTIGERGLEEEFAFFNYDSLAWFMLDSLYQTILKNIPAMAERDIFYAMENGEGLVLKNLSPPMDFTLETPYMGSAFYFNHMGGRGDPIEDEPVG